MREIQRHLREEGRDRVGAIRSLRLPRAAMLSCCLMMVPPMRGEARSPARSSEAGATSAASGSLRRPRRPVPRRLRRSRSSTSARRTMAMTSTTHTPNVAALTSSRLLVPTSSTANEVIAAPVAPPGWRRRR